MIAAAVSFGLRRTEKGREKEEERKKERARERERHRKVHIYARTLTHVQLCTLKFIYLHTLNSDLYAYLNTYIRSHTLIITCAHV